MLVMLRPNKSWQRSQESQSVSQAVSCRLLTAEDRVRSQGIPYRIYSGKSELGTRFFLCPSV